MYDEISKIPYEGSSMGNYGCSGYDFRDKSQKTEKRSSKGDVTYTRRFATAIFSAKQHHDIFDNATLCHPYFILNVRSSSTCRVLTSACESLSLKKRNMLFVDRPFKYKHIHWRRPKTGIASRWYVTS